MLELHLQCLVKGLFSALGVTVLNLIQHQKLTSSTLRSSSP